jgi:ArsR family transcriptional regulator
MSRDDKEDGMDELVRVMKALSDPGRVGILKLLGGRELCACEIIRALKLAQPTISRHMKVLADAGLITGRKVGSWVHYRVAEKPASPYARVMLAQLSGWLEDDPGLAALRACLGESRSCGEKSRAGEKDLRP